ncbi:hypothetical protein BOX15_Mlig011607g3 [Macrostomum lignano]|uniref:RRM domain-containing protein n=1 Tax=Macrostomum lignano TaxID=282301 RepID=A0A267F0B4_9PLAT|nr:hypothetical protein BOX15_Mlig011607g3 [Macrostomum lignano]
MPNYCQCPPDHSGLWASVYVAGVPYSKSARSRVQIFFSAAGRIMSVRVCAPRKDNFGGTGFAFVDFACAHGAYAAVLRFNGSEFHGCRLSVQLAESGLRNQLQPAPWSLAGGAVNGRQKESSIYLVNARALSRQHLFTEVLKLVKPLGKIGQIKINWNPVRELWNAFVYSPDPSFAERAVSKLKGVRILDSEVEIGAFRQAESRPVKTGRGGGGGAGGKPDAMSQPLCELSEAELLHQRRLAVEAGTGFAADNPLLSNSRASQRLKRVVDRLAELLCLVPFQASRLLLLPDTEPPQLTLMKASKSKTMTTGASATSASTVPKSRDASSAIEETSELEINYRLMCSGEQFARSSDLLAAQCAAEDWQ